MVQTSNPRWAKVFITEYSPCPGTVRSKLGRDEIEDPCTRKSTGSGGSPARGAAMRLRNMASETEPFLAVYSALQILGAAEFLVCAIAVEAATAPAIISRRVIWFPSDSVYCKTLYIRSSNGLPSFGC